MYRPLLLFWLLVAAKFAHGTPSNRVRRVAGGLPTLPHGRPWQVALFSPSVEDWTVYTEFYCGGSVLDEMNVLTAAHCCESQTDIMIRAGSNTLYDEDPAAQEVDVALMRIHASYNEKCFGEHDICVLRLKQPLNMTRFVSPIALPEQGEEFPIHSKAVVSGWGGMGVNKSDVSTLLREVELVITSEESCNKAWGYESYNPGFPVLCTSFPDLDACQGDSGGPLVCNGDVLCGVVSAGDDRCDSSYPGIYAKVSAYRLWIDRTLAASDNDTDVWANKDSYSEHCDWINAVYDKEPAINATSASLETFITIAVVLCSLLVVAILLLLVGVGMILFYKGRLQSIEADGRQQRGQDEGAQDGKELTSSLL